MKHKWQIRRSTIARLDGQRRWDCAYQCLLRWASEAASQTNDNSPSSTQQGGPSNESRDLRSCLDTTPAKGADH
jgi:hypothetical protein